VPPCTGTSRTQEVWISYPNRISVCRFSRPPLIGGGAKTWRAEVRLSLLSISFSTRGRTSGSASQGSSGARWSTGSRESLRSAHERAQALLEIEADVGAIRDRWAALTAAPSPMHSPRWGPSTETAPLPRRRRRRAGDGPGLVSVTLGELAKERLSSMQVTGGKPVAVRMPHGTEIPVQHWSEVAVIVVGWLAEQKEVPLPFAGREHTQRWFLNSSPKHPDGTPFKPGPCKRAGSRQRPI
jgi:hypothetical protein